CLLSYLHFPVYIFFFNDPATTEIYTLSLHDALPISPFSLEKPGFDSDNYLLENKKVKPNPDGTLEEIRAYLNKNEDDKKTRVFRSEEHTSELQSRENLVCRLLLEKKKKTTRHTKNNK